MRSMGGAGCVCASASQFYLRDESRAILNNQDPASPLSSALLPAWCEAINEEAVQRRLSSTVCTYKLCTGVRQFYPP